MPELSVLHISTADNVGGSGRSAYKIHCGLREQGHTSRMLVRYRVTDDPDVDTIHSRGSRMADRAARLATDALSLQYCWIPSSNRVFQHPWYQAADVVQLYNMHGNFLSLSILPRLCREKTVVWRLSDMWPLTGHCAYAGDCTRWQTGCGSCPDLKIFPSLKWDTTHYLWQRKRRLYERSRFHVVAPSNWIADLARQSPLLNGFPRSVIRNGVDTQSFDLLSQDKCRQKLATPRRGRGLLFIADDIHSPFKGLEHFWKAVQHLHAEGNSSNIFVMLVGAGATQDQRQWPCPVWRHERIECNQRLTQVYNAADVVVHAATMDNLPNSVLEAMACGRPAVAFDAGGVPEVVEHRRNGFVADCGDSRSLAQGIQWIFAPETNWQELSDRCRRHIERAYPLERQATSFANLYQRLLTESPVRGEPRQVA